MNIDHINELLENKFNIKREKVYKNNEYKEALIIKPIDTDNELSRVFYLENYENFSDEEMALCIFERFKESFLDIDTSIINDYNLAKPHIIMCCCRNKPSNHIFFVNAYDFYAYFRITFSIASDYETVASAIITNDMISSWNIDTSTIIVDAVEKLKDNALIVSLDEIVGMPAGTTNMYVISNNTKIFGAAGMINTTILDKVRELYEGKNYWILPSSIHEVLTVIDNGQTAEELQILVSEVNYNEVKEEEWLSFSVYYYDGEELKIFSPEGETKDDN